MTDGRHCGFDLLFKQLSFASSTKAQDIDTNSVHFTVGRGEKEVSVCRAELGPLG